MATRKGYVRVQQSSSLFFGLRKPRVDFLRGVIITASVFWVGDNPKKNNRDAKQPNCQRTQAIGSFLVTSRKTTCIMQTLYYINEKIVNIF